MNDQWYFTRDGNTFGPVTLHDLHQLAASGQLNSATLIWRDGMADWLPATALGIAVAPAAIPPPVAESVAVSRPPPGPMSTPAVWMSPAPVLVDRPPEPVRPAPLPVRTTSRAAVSPLIISLGVVILALALVVGWMAHALSQSGASTLAQRPSTTNRTAPNSLTKTSSAPRRDDRRAVDTTTPAPPSVTVAPTPTSPPGSLAPPTTSPPSATVPTPEPSPSTTTSPPPPAAPVTSTPKPGSPPSSKGPKILYQEIDLARSPKFAILGSVMAQDLHYQILSELYVDEPDAQGVQMVEQAVIDTRLLRADELSQATFTNSLRELKGWRCRYKVHRQGEVTDLTVTKKGGRETVAVAPMGAQGFLLTSVLDADGWREIAELTFFVPQSQETDSAPWTRRATHDFGPLGSWYGMTRYEPRAVKDGLRQIDFTHQLAYQPPAKDVGGLPFTIVSATLKPDVAGGSIQLDEQKRRVVSAQEKFQVRGIINAELAGQSVPIELQESQSIQVRVFDRKPW